MFYLSVLGETHSNFMKESVISLASLNIMLLINFVKHQYGFVMA